MTTGIVVATAERRRQVKTLLKPLLRSWWHFGGRGTAPSTARQRVTEGLGELEEQGIRHARAEEEVAPSEHAAAAGGHRGRELLEIHPIHTAPVRMQAHEIQISRREGEGDAKRLAAEERSRRPLQSKAHGGGARGELWHACAARVAVERQTVHVRVTEPEQDVVGERENTTHGCGQRQHRGRVVRQPANFPQRREARAASAKL